MFFIQFIGIYKHYKEFNFAISVEEEYRENIVFPGVTICLDAWMDSVRTCAYTNNRCSRSDMTYSIGLYYVQTNPELRKFGAFPPSDLFDCTMKHPSCKSFKCKDAMRATYFRMPSQLCYTVDVTQYQNKVVSTCPYPWMYELELKYKLNRSRVITFMPTNVFPLVVHAPNSAPPDRLTAITMQPGAVFEVAMKQQRIRRLKAPYKSKCVDYGALGYKQEFGGYLNFDLCLQNCSMHLELKRCGCIRSAHEYAGHQRYPICNFTYGDSCGHMMYASDVYKVCEKICGMPCEQISYDLKLVSLGLESGSTSDKKNKFTLKLSFGSDAEEVTKYVPAFTYTECLAYIGAYMGTWIGIAYLDTLLSFESWYATNKRFIKHSMKSYVGMLVAPTPEPPMTGQGDATMDPE
ncbi:amiloride-sensitive sodium channel subunit alpha-like [Galendromus occidentalis]|uniref:Amiloride-sensitive sodium channel subunit alpha-like n=1 Tax=Galendromus occidentalis TaxID=34638 RepID=A0AAJ7L8D0_9ACAR|nr:amiloride-sensitive sodium channel subunit alpha-like [Galendromus occidentalis]